MTCQQCSHEFCWQCRKPFTSEHFDSGWCTMYGQSPTIFYAKTIGKQLISRALPFLELSSSVSDSESSEDEGLGGKIQELGEILAEKKEELKEDIADQWEVTKEKATDAFAKLKSFF